MKRVGNSRTTTKMRWQSCKWRTGNRSW